MPEETIHYRIRSQVVDGQHIEIIEVLRDTHWEEFSRTVLDLRNKALERSLIYMGWTPPEGHND